MLKFLSHQEPSTIKELTSSFIFLVATTLPVKAVTYVDFGNVQYAGEIGFLSAGLGKKFFERYELGFMYGVVPGHLAGGAALETFTLRQTWDVLEFERGKFYLGLNVFHVVGIRYETAAYGDAPRGYYSIGSIRGLLNLGTALNVSQSNQLSLYLEGGISDVWIENTIANYPAVNPWKHTSLALGLRKDFN